MIYDPITRQSVVLLGRYSPQATAVRFGQQVEGTFHFCRVRYGEHLPGFSGGFEVGHERDQDINSLVADDGYSEILRAYKALPLIADTWETQGAAAK